MPAASRLESARSEHDGRDTERRRSRSTRVWTPPARRTPPWTSNRRTRSWALCRRTPFRPRNRVTPPSPPCSTKSSRTWRRSRTSSCTSSKTSTRSGARRCPPPATRGLRRATSSRGRANRIRSSAAHAPMTPSCTSRIRRSSRPAAYCPADNTIYLSLQWLYDRALLPHINGFPQERMNAFLVGYHTGHGERVHHLVADGRTCSLVEVREQRDQRKLVGSAHTLK